MMGAAALSEEEAAAAAKVAGVLRRLKDDLFSPHCEILVASLHLETSPPPPSIAHLFSKTFKAASS